MFLKDTRKFKDSTKRADKFAEGCGRNSDLQATRCLENLHSARGNKMKEEGRQDRQSGKAIGKGREMIRPPIREEEGKDSGRNFLPGRIG
jgi:hypothetical protein